MPANTTKIPTPPAASLLPIRTVSTLTGVNAVTLRAWERRYGLVTPKRTPKGHRLYSHQDVLHIRQIVDLLSQGISVSHVKPLLGNDTDADLGPSSADGGNIWTTYQEAMLSAIEQFNESVLDNAYNNALSLYPIDIVNQQLTTPLLRLLGERWDKSATGIAEEHFFTLYLRNKLGARIHHINRHVQGPFLLLACLPDELHEIGLLFCAIDAVNTGYRVLILGSNTPLQQIPGVLAKKPCVGIILSATMKPSGTVLKTALPELIGQTKLPVFIGGHAAVSHQQQFEQAGAICLGEDIASGLLLANKTLKTHGPR